MGQGMCVSSRLPPGEDESSPEDYKPPLGLSSTKQHHGSSKHGKQQHSRHGSSSKKKVKLKQLPVKVRVFLKSPNKTSAQLGDGRSAHRTAADGLGGATGDGGAATRTRPARPTAADVIPGVVQRLQLKHQQSLEKEDEEKRPENGNVRSDRNSTSSAQSSDTIENDGTRPRTRSFTLKTEKKRVVSTSSEPADESSPPEATASAAPLSQSQSKALSPRTSRTTRTVTTDPKVGLNIIKETTILQDGDEEDAPLAQLDELKQFYSFEGILEIKYTKITRTRTGEDVSPVVPYKYTRTTVTSRNASPSVSPRSLSPTFTPGNPRPVTPTQTFGTQTMADEPPCVATPRTPTRLAVPRSLYYSELDSDSDCAVMDTDGDSSTLSTQSDPDAYDAYDAQYEYVRLISPEDADDESDEEEEEEEEEIQEEWKASSHSVANTSYDSIGIPPPHEYDSARSMSESSSLTSVTMLPSPVSWSVPLREVDIAEDLLSPSDTLYGVETPCTDTDPDILEDIHERVHVQDQRVESDHDSGVDHGEGRSDESVVVEEKLSRNYTNELHHEPVLGATADPSYVSEQDHTCTDHADQHQPRDQPRGVSNLAHADEDHADQERPRHVPKPVANKPKGSKTPLTVRKHTPPFTSDRIPFTTAASSWPFRIRPASMMFQFNRQYIGRSGQGNALMMLFGPLIYNPNFPWHEALVTLKVPRHVIKDMNAHLAICSTQEKRKKTGIRILDTIGRTASKELDDDEPREDEGTDVDAGRNVEALLVVEVQDPQEKHKGKKSSKPKDSSQEYCFTKTPPKKDDSECIIV
ncbi:uncharacterized protein [Amphiura filiformis]|uniref:uncharacterized protein n=1 Tax=Amphiura filiformis TaxID=82378 RepID=UPI003B225FC6